MADVAIVSDYLAGIAFVLAIVTTETTRRSQVTDVVWMSLPVSLHFREEISLEDPLHLRDSAIN